MRLPPISSGLALLATLLLVRSGLAADASLTAALNSISTNELQRHVDVLADDTFEGREAGSRGGTAAAKYLSQHLERLGMQGGGVDGGYRQSFDGRYRNLLAVLPGSDPQLKREFVLVGAHYDHVGYGSPTNSYGPTGYIHNGADDNASGAATLLEVVDAFSHLALPPKRSLLFVFWDGEEKGLLGSKHWVANPSVPLEQVRFLVNIDMVGRLRNQQLQVLGSRSGFGLRQLVSRENRDRDLTLDFSWELQANSDHWPFYQRNIPFLMFHTGLHDDYHRPSDDAHKVNHEGMRHVARLLFNVAHGLAQREGLTRFRADVRRELIVDRRQLLASPPADPPRLGVSWRQTDDGSLTLTRVGSGTPAADAGLQAGDRLLAFNGQVIADGKQFRRAVFEAARDIQLTVQRAGAEEPLPVSVQLAGQPLRLGISWREDAAEPGSVVLTRVTSESPADRAALRRGDRVLGVNERTFGNGRELAELIGQLPDPLRLTVEREGRLREVEVGTVAAQQRKK